MAQQEHAVGTEALVVGEGRRARRREVEIGSMEGKAIALRGDRRFTDLPQSGLVQRGLHSRYPTTAYSEMSYIVIRSSSEDVIAARAPVMAALNQLNM
jgi:hypothetical protein